MAGSSPSMFESDPGPKMIKPSPVSVKRGRSGGRAMFGQCGAEVDQTSGEVAQKLGQLGRHQDNLAGTGPIRTPTAAQS